MWDERYNTDEYVYGTKPNEFLYNYINELPKGKVLSIAEGEGRNALFLAQQGYQVTAVDSSIVGLKKAERLANKHKVDIEFIHADLAQYDFGQERWDGVVSIFCPLPSAIRKRVYHNLQTGLKPGGVFLVEAYTPEQIKLATGGGKDIDVMQTKASLLKELKDVNFKLVQECNRNIIEGSFHTGMGAVVQGIATKEKYMFDG